MAVVEVACRHCGQTEQASRYGKGHAGHQRFGCMNCNKSFQLEYAYEAHKLGVKDRVVGMVMNGSGVRDTMRVLKVGINTVIRTLKKSGQKQQSRQHYKKFETTESPDNSRQIKLNLASKSEYINQINAWQKRGTLLIDNKWNFVKSCATYLWKLTMIHNKGAIYAAA